MERWDRSDSVRDGRLSRAFGMNMDELTVERGVGEAFDQRLVYQQPWRRAQHAGFVIV